MCASNPTLTQSRYRWSQYRNAVASGPTYALNQSAPDTVRHVCICDRTRRYRVAVLTSLPPRRAYPISLAPDTVRHVCIYDRTDLVATQSSLYAISLTREAHAVRQKSSTVSSMRPLKGISVAFSSFSRDHRIHSSVGSRTSRVQMSAQRLKQCPSVAP